MHRAGHRVEEDEYAFLLSGGSFLYLSIMFYRGVTQ
jgi:hypothetical protein